MLIFPAEIKRLAEKEDWIVDNEGLTSLVSLNTFQWLMINVYNIQNKWLILLIGSICFLHCNSKSSLETEK